MRIDESSLEAFLIDTGLAEKKTISLAVAESKRTGDSLDKVLASKGLLTERDLKRVSSFLLGIPFVNLQGEEIPYSVLSLVPEPMARRHNVVAFKKDVKSLHIALTEPHALGEVKFLEHDLGLKLIPHMTDESSIKHGLRLYHEGLRKEFGELIQMESQSIKEDITEEASEEELKAFATDSRITRILDALISHALLSKATHIHIEPRAGALHIRYRLGKTLHDAMILPKHVTPHLVLRTKHLALMDLKDTTPQEGKIKYEDGKTKVSLRVSTILGSEGEKMVIRRVPTHASGFTLESLGLRGQMLEDVHQILEEKEGLFLVSSPKSSGKTTFLYTALDLLHKDHDSIQTIEEKVEYLIPGIHQSEVNKDKGITTQRLLRAALRQDPDVVMVSSAEEEGTASLLSSFALRGGLGLVGVEAGSAGQAIVKFSEEAGVGLASSALSGSIGIRLAKRIGGRKEKYFLNKDEINSLGQLVDLERMLWLIKEEGLVKKEDTWKEVPFWKAIRQKGDEDSGYTGLFEVIKVNKRVREYVMNPGAGTSIEAEVAKLGALTLLEDGILKAVIGSTTLEEVLLTLS